jgi:peptidylprolyl isomerase
MAAIGTRRSFLSSSFNPEGSRKGRRTADSLGPVLSATQPVEMDEDLMLQRKRLQDVEERRLKEWENYQRSHRSNIDQHAVCKVFFDFTIADVPLGRIVLDLFEDAVPEAVENFRALATGSTGYDNDTGFKLDYLDSTAHRIDKGVAVYLGEIQSQSLSSTGQPVRDENFAARHLHRGVVSMVSRGPNTIGSVFCITLDRAPQLDYKYMVIGKVVDGLGLLEKIEAVPTTRTGRPTVPIQINFCGALTGPKPPGTIAAMPDVVAVHRDSEHHNSELETSDKIPASFVQAES